MIDVVSPILGPDGIRHASIICLWVSAIIIGFLAFAATKDAGFRCPLAFLRAALRLFMVLFAISVAYLAAWLGETPDRVPTGPALLVDMTMMLVFLCSCAIILFSPPIPRENSWDSAWQNLRRAVSDKVGGGARRRQPNDAASAR